LAGASVVSPASSFAGDNGTFYGAANDANDANDDDDDEVCSVRRGHFRARTP
jgi:hypothetical protein